MFKQTDLLHIIAYWGQANTEYDTNNSGAVDVSDHLFVIEGLGDC